MRDCMTSPCFGCTQRTATCHATCHRPTPFEAWRREQAAERLRNVQLNEITFEGVRKNMANLKKK